MYEFQLGGTHTRNSHDIVSLTTHDVFLPVDGLRALLLALTGGRGPVEGGDALGEAGAAHSVARVVFLTWTQDEELDSMGIVGMNYCLLCTTVIMNGHFYYYFEH